MTTKFAFVAIIGKTNVGKSTLINRLIGEKISIVSPKVQTTRSRVRGILTENETQLVLVDTPGIFKPQRRLDRAMLDCAWTESADSDLQMMVMDAKKGLTETDISILQKIKESVILVFNKIDLVQKDELIKKLTALNDIKNIKTVFCISAQTGEGVKELKEYLLENAPNGPWMFSDEELTDLPDKLFCAEITREKLFLYLREELPYQLTVEPVSFKEQKQSIRIEQNIIVSRTAHKSIILGAGGKMIKKIGEAARMEMTRQLGKKVNLFLFVKVRQDWVDDVNQYQQWGLNFNA